MADFSRHDLDELAARIADRQFREQPEIFARYPAAGRKRCLEDARFHLRYLAAALDADSLGMFLDYIGWTKVLLAARDVPAADLAANLHIMRDAVAGHDSGGGEAVRYVEAAIEQLPSMPDEAPSLLDPRAPFWSVASAYLAALLRGSRGDALKAVLEAMEGGTSLREIYRHVFEPVQQEIGRLWQVNRLTVAQEHFCTAATQHIMTRLYGTMFSGEKHERRAVGMCVGGELHEIGLRIVTDLLELEGWQTWYLGASVPPASAVQFCIERKADVLLISATLPPHLPAVAELVALVRARPELAHVRVIVGGGAFRSAPSIWRTIGADGYAANADDCLALLEQPAP